MIVEDRHVAHAQPGLRAVKINFNSIVIYRNHPEHIVTIDVYVVVVDLQWKTEWNLRSNRNGVKVKSNESKGTVMLAPVGSNELALTKAHVSLIGKRHGCAGHRVGSGSISANVGEPNEAIEIGDL